MSKTTLKEVSELITKGTTPSSVGCEFVNDGINYIKSESISDSKFLDNSIYEHIDIETDKKLKRSRISEGDLLFSIAGAYLGKIAIVQAHDLPANTNQAVGIVRLKKYKANVDYIYYYFSQKNINAYINKLSSQSSQPNLNLDLLGKLEFEYKDIEEQQKIASVLSSLDSKIELNNKINAELVSMARTIYDYWFVQFDFPDKNGKAYKSSGGKMVLRKEMKRKIPEGWEVNCIGNILSTSLGGTPSTKVAAYWDGPVHWLNSGEIANFPIISSELKINKEAIKNSATQLMPKGTVLLSITRHLRPTVLAIDACANQSVVGIKEKDEIKYYFIYPYLKNEIPRLMTLRTGAQQPHINKEIVDASLIVVPRSDSGILKQYNSTVGSLYENIINNAFQNQHLSELRDWLLPMLMNGQVSVDKAYEHIDEVLSMAAEREEKYAKVISLSIPKNKSIFTKQVLAGKIVSLFKNDKNFTHIKFQKLQFLAEHIAEADLNLNYYFQTAGPYDNRFMHTIFDSFKKSKWFDKREYKFIELEKQQEIEGYYKEIFSPVSNRLDKLFNLLSDATEAQAEIIATVYAVWNNRMILKQTVAEEKLIEDFYNWSDKKQQYSRAQIQKAIHWLKQNDFEPVGFGKEIKRAKGKGIT